MSEDVMSDLLRAVHLRGALFFYVEGTSPWVVEAPPAREVLALVMPRAQHLIEFHVIVAGSCWGGVVGEPGLALSEGDVILFPHGDAHVLSSAPGLRSARTARDFFFSPRPPRLPWALSLGSEPETTAKLDGGGKRGITIACGFLGLDDEPFNPLLAALPRVLRIPGDRLQNQSWMTTFLRSVVTESSRRQPGGEAVLQRMSEALFIEVLRCYLDTLPPDATGWLAGMRDPSVGRALALLHGSPARAWTVHELGREVALSKSALHARFVDMIGMSPMHYLTRWRMQLACELLRDTGAKHLAIALEVGYESEAAFSRAFKREVGISPGSWQRERASVDAVHLSVETSRGGDEAAR